MFFFHGHLLPFLFPADSVWIPVTAICDYWRHFYNICLYLLSIDAYFFVIVIIIDIISGQLPNLSMQNYLKYSKVNKNNIGAEWIYGKK